MTTPSEKLLAKVMADGASPKEVAERLEKYAKIQRGLSACTINQREAAARYDEECRKILARRTAIRNTCDHPDTTYHGSPCGGSDSHTECNVCGAEL